MVTGSAVVWFGLGSPRLSMTSWTTSRSGTSAATGSMPGSGASAIAGTCSAAGSAAGSGVGSGVGSEGALGTAWLSSCSRSASASSSGSSGMAATSGMASSSGMATSSGMASRSASASSSGMSTSSGMASSSGMAGSSGMASSSGMFWDGVKFWDGVDDVLHGTKVRNRYQWRCGRCRRDLAGRNRRRDDLVEQVFEGGQRFQVRDQRRGRLNSQRVGGLSRRFGVGCWRGVGEDLVEEFVEWAEVWDQRWCWFRGGCGRGFSGWVGGGFRFGGCRWCSDRLGRRGWLYGRFRCWRSWHRIIDDVGRGLRCNHDSSRPVGRCRRFRWSRRGWVW